VTAKERAERLLDEARAMIRDLQTKLGHGSLAKDEVLETVRRLETETRVAAHAEETVASELAAERLARRIAEDALAEALAGRQEAEQRIRDANAARTGRRPSKPLLTRRVTVGPFGAARGDANAPDSAAGQNAHEMPARIRTAEAPSIVEDLPTGKQVRRRGRPINVGNDEPEVVEWWKPGWQRKLR
jgi:hypothetical protein